MLELNRIYNTDCLEALRLLDDSSINLTLASPPYDLLRTYRGYSFDFESIAQELFRVTKPGGVIVWVVGDATIKGSESGTSFRQALYFKEVGFRLHDTMLYVKQNPLPQNHNRYESAFEYMFVFSKGAPATFNPILEPCKLAGQICRGSTRQRDGTMKAKTGNGKPVNSHKVKSNLWVYPATKVGDSGNHPAVFPLQLALDQINSWTNEGDTVLDIFSGSGTTCKAAKQLKRNYLGFEISHEYCAIAEKRLAGFDSDPTDNGTAFLKSLPDPEQGA